MSGILARQLRFTGKNIGELQRLGFSACIIREIQNDEARRTGGSEVEIAGYLWRRGQGLGRPFNSGCSRGGSSGYRERRAAEESARRRKAQKAARVRQRAALTERIGRVINAAKKVLARKAGRGT